jgi:hypothetical protein
MLSRFTFVVNLMKQRCSTCNNAESLREAKIINVRVLKCGYEASKYQIKTTESPKLSLQTRRENGIWFVVN